MKTVKKPWVRVGLPSDGAPALVLAFAMVLAACSSGGSGAVEASATAGAEPTSTSEVMPVPAIGLGAEWITLRDPDGPLGGSMDIGRMRVPAGWRAPEVQREVWNDASGCPALVGRLAIRMISPDGASALEFRPSDAWIASGTERDVEACPSRPERDVPSYLKAQILHTHPDARILDYEDLPRPAQALQASVEGQLDGSGADEPVRRSYHAGRMLSAYLERGVEMREMRIALMMLSYAPDGNILAYSPGMIIYHAPHGQLDFSLPGRVESTKELNPAWLEAVAARSARARQRYEETPDGKRASALNAAILANAQMQREQRAANRTESLSTPTARD